MEHLDLCVSLLMSLDRRHSLILTSCQLNHRGQGEGSLTGSMGSAYLPSVIYTVRGVVARERSQKRVFFLAFTHAFAFSLIEYTPIRFDKELSSLQTQLWN